MINLGILGHNPYTLLISEAIAKQPDFNVVGAYSHEPTPFSKEISRRLNVFCSESGLPLFKERGIRVSGLLDDFIDRSDVFLEYESNTLAMKISFGSAGFRVAPKDSMRERLSQELPLEKVYLREVSEIIACCPQFKLFRTELTLSRSLDKEEIIDSLLSTSRIGALYGGNVSLTDLCLFLSTSVKPSLFSCIVLLDSMEIKEGSKTYIDFLSLVGRLLVLPEAIDTIRESNKIYREISKGITDKSLNIRSGLVT